MTFIKESFPQEIYGAYGAPRSRKQGMFVIILQVLPRVATLMYILHYQQGVWLPKGSDRFIGFHWYIGVAPTRARARG